MARYITMSRKQRERQEKAERREQERRRLKRQALTTSIVAAAGGVGNQANRTEAKGKQQADTRRRRNPESEVNRTNDGMIAQQIQVADVNEDRFYVIEKLLKKRRDRLGNEHYLVRWQNYPPEYDSWEPRKEIEKNALDMIHQFESLNYPTDCKPDDLHCICRKPYKFTQGGMIQCYECNIWYHFTCLNMNMVEANSYERYYGECCRQKNPKLKNIIKHDKVSTLYGNSTLTRVANDNEGILLQP